MVEAHISYLFAFFSPLSVSPRPLQMAGMETSAGTLEATAQLALRWERHQAVVLVQLHPCWLLMSRDDGGWPQFTSTVFDKCHLQAWREAAATRLASAGEAAVWRRPLSPSTGSNGNVPDRPDKQLPAACGSLWWPNKSFLSLLSFCRFLGKDL